MAKDKEEKLYDTLKELYKNIKFNKFSQLNSIWFVKTIGKLVKNYNSGKRELTTQELKDVKLMVEKVLKCQYFEASEKEKLTALQPQIDDMDIFSLAK